MTEYCNGGDLERFKELRLVLSEKECHLVIKQIVNGLKEIHALNIVHRDLKLANILLNFPDSGLELMNSSDKREFIKTVDL